MAVKLTIPIVILACVNGVFLLSPPVVTDSPPLPPPQCGANEGYSACGNLCEDNCNNRCEAPALQYFSSLNPLKNPECQAGCYCEPGFIRNSAGTCEINTPTVCGSENNRCGVISPNAVYQKCLAGASAACFQRTIAVRPAGFNGRCICQEGYALNLSKKCVKINSPACISQENKPSNILYMQTTYDC